MAIKLKQLAKASNQEISVCIIDKGGALGSHIISGNVFEPRALTELFPNWKDLPNVPLQTPASSDEFLVLAERRSISIPHFLLPKQLNNDGNYVISLSQLVRWLGEQAEQLGVEIYPGFAADEVLYSEDGTTVRGVSGLMFIYVHWHLSLQFLQQRSFRTLCPSISGSNKRCWNKQKWRTQRQLYPWNRINWSPNDLC